MLAITAVDRELNEAWRSSAGAGYRWNVWRWHHPTQAKTVTVSDSQPAGRPHKQRRRRNAVPLALCRVNAISQSLVCITFRYAGFRWFFLYRLCDLVTGNKRRVSAGGGLNGGPYAVCAFDNPFLFLAFFVHKTGK